MSDFESKKDDFWDIDKLVPKKRASLTRFSTENVTKTFEEKLSATAENEAEKWTREQRRLSILGTRETESQSYEPQGNSLIKRVTINRFIDKYDFYDSFRKAALLYFDYKTERCDFAPFYSYMPQYSQLNREQKNYYFYWRSELRRKHYLKTDYSYVYLYVYEILNLPDKIKPEEGIKLLCELWHNYRDSLRRLDNYLSIWVQDYCLIYSLPCPTEEIRDFIFDAVSVSSFKEFYLSDINKTGQNAVSGLLAYLSDYDWRKGKFADGEHKALYRAVMEGAMSEVVSLALLESSGTAERKTATLKRDAFPGSLCTHSVKCKIEIEYYPIAEADEMRRGVTAAVRYTENKLRGLLGVKSRLAVKDLPDTYRRIIDTYFNAIVNKAVAKEHRRSVPEYERLYDAPGEKMTLEGADEIELASWETTARLVTEAECEECAPEAEPIVEEAQEVCVGEDCYGLTEREIEFLKACLESKDSFSELDADALAEHINEAFADNFGDVILECCNNGYSVIEDYEGEVKEWLLKITK